jgi:glycosyltransferase involved in cell wall biosynthesis
VDKPTVSVIICCYTEERLKDIHEAVESVLVQTLKPREVIIAIDHNKQLYQKLAETYRDSVEIGSDAVNLIQCPNLQSPVPNPQSPIPSPQSPIPVVLVLNRGAQGLSETRNVGIRASSGDIVAFIDDDALAGPDWLENLVKPFQSPIPYLQSHVVAVAGRAIPLWLNGSRPFWFPEELDWIVGCTYKGLPTGTPNFEPRTLNSELRTIRNVAGCNMAFRKGVFEKAGFWGGEIGAVGQKLKGGEEAELCLRIKHRIPQTLILYEADALVYHKVPRRRATLRWIAIHSFAEGSCKAKVDKLSSRFSQKRLSTETSYLRYLIFQSIPERLARFYRGGSLPQIAAIITCIAATGVGYLVQWMRA